MEKIVIIGGGLSGSLLAINLLRLSRRNALDIVIIDSNPPEMLGTAYSTDKHYHLLNVPAHKMSAFPDKSEDFTDWMSESGYSYQARSFVPRQIYKQYIKEILRKEWGNANSNARYTSIRDKAVDILPSERIVILASGEKIPFDKVVLALGNFEPADLPLADGAYRKHPAYFASPWAPHLFDNIGEDKDILIIGTGLTMVDTVLTLQHRRHKGKIIALSTHGFIPAFHADTAPYVMTDLRPEDIRTALGALTLVNKHLKLAARQGISWHAVIDAFRPFVQQIWLHLPIEEKRRFMEHLRHIWGVARHRMPQECAEKLYRSLREGQLSIIAGRIRSIRDDNGNGFGVIYDERSSRKQVSLHAGAIVNCMGPASDYTKLRDSLVSNLLEKGMIRTDKLKLGIDCTPEGIVLEKSGELSPFLYTIGLPAKGILWEITSVPEIRASATRLAGILARPISSTLMHQM